ncbi:hypothetical protein DL767_008559 [Monosporascus sp. MG133]|nr:hypothetical protein DL767_008559 [Monosporascus sp. MG133]
MHRVEGQSGCSSLHNPVIVFRVTHRAAPKLAAPPMSSLPVGTPILSVSRHGVEKADLGFSGTRPFGSEIKTPVLDRVPNEGVRLASFHRASACSPTRSMVFSGIGNHVTGLGRIAEHIGKNRELFNCKPRYESYLNFHVAALSEILQDSGYLTLISGKWLVPGPLYPARSRNHYNYEPQFKEGEPRPSLATADPNVFWMRDSQYLNRWTGLPSDFCSTKTFTGELLDYSQNRNLEKKGKPFFPTSPTLRGVGA